MALFKIFKGAKDDLPSKKTEGYAYVTSDEHKMYIDIDDENRIPLNAENADQAEKTKGTLTFGKGTSHELVFDGSTDINIPLYDGTTL